MAVFAEWESFYVIVGSAAGALTGLQFVVMTLIARKPPLRREAAGAAFITPTIVHFAAALLLAAVLCAPWPMIIPIAAICGLHRPHRPHRPHGGGYAALVARRMRRQTTYRPDLEDWLCHVLLPLAAYAILAVSALAAPSRTLEALFGVATATLLLLFIGIHNAWDTVSYHVLVNTPDTDAEPT